MVGKKRTPQYKLPFFSNFAMNSREFTIIDV
jgi:hypothetical protein